MAVIPRYEKHPSAIRDYPIDVLNLGSNTIGSPSSVVSPSGLTIVQTTATGSRVIVRCSGGTAGVNYQVETSIPISNGETLVQEFTIQVRDN